jgi:DNA polymerase
MNISDLTAEIEMSYGNPMQVISDCLRSFVVSAPGNDLVVADYSNIEGRGLAWLAGDDAKLHKFKLFDQGKAPDMYIQGYATAFNVPLFDKNDPRRQTGKTMELFSGYQGAHGAYLKGLKPKDLPNLTIAVRDAVPQDEWTDAEDKWNGSHDLPLDQWAAIRILVDRWRASHPEIVSYWYDLEEAAVRAVNKPNTITKCGPSGRQIKYLKKGSFLLCQLPSGRRLSYPYPSVKMEETPWGKLKPKLYYKSVDSVTRHWGLTTTYGGKLAENVTQAICRDLLDAAIKLLEEAGYWVVMHVHDEIVSEVPEDFGSLEEFCEIMCDLPDWAAGFPVAAEGYRAKRYRKG